MVKLSHKTLKSKIAEQNWTQFADGGIAGDPGDRRMSTALLEKTSAVRYSFLQRSKDHANTGFYLLLSMYWQSAVPGEYIQQSV